MIWIPEAGLFFVVFHVAVVGFFALSVLLVLPISVAILLASEDLQLVYYTSSSVSKVLKILSFLCSQLQVGHAIRGKRSFWIEWI